MTPPREQDYEAQAGKLFRAVMDAPPRTDRVGMIAAALRAASNAALERAAQKVRECMFAGHSDAQPEPEPPHWRIGRHYAIHVYRGDTPIATFHAVEDAQAAVRAYNANLDLSAPAPDLAAQLDELSNALASHADAGTGAKWDRLRAAVGARDQRIAELEEHLRGAYRQNREPPRDFACADCRTGSEMLVKGFRCWWHVGESLARSAACPGAALTEKT